MAAEIVASNPLLSAALFFIAAIAEIAGGYLVWLWIRQKKTIALGAVGAIILFVYGIIPTLQPSDNFGRIYAAYGGIFIVSCIIWGVVDKKKPDRYEIVGSLVAILGAAIIFYAPC